MNSRKLPTEVSMLNRRTGFLPLVSDILPSKGLKISCMTLKLASRNPIPFAPEANLLA